MRTTLGLVLLLLLSPADHAARRRVRAAEPSRARATPARQATAERPALFRIDAARSRFMVEALAGGVLWFKGHDHLLQVKDFTGDVALSPPRLSLRARADSLAETRDVFTDEQKRIIDRELRETVLEADKYPEIIFESTAVEVEAIAGGRLRAKIEGDLTLRGVTRRISIPAEVTATGGSELRARGEFTIKRGDFKVPAASAFHGTVRVRDRLKFTFDILARDAADGR